LPCAADRAGSGARDPDATRALPVAWTRVRVDNLCDGSTWSDRRAHEAYGPAQSCGPVSAVDLFLTACFVPVPADPAVRNKNEILPDAEDCVFYHQQKQTSEAVYQGTLQKGDEPVGHSRCGSNKKEHPSNPTYKSKCYLSSRFKNSTQRKIRAWLNLIFRTIFGCSVPVIEKTAIVYLCFSPLFKFIKDQRIF
jgi:hypothetical protein